MREKLLQQPALPDREREDSTTRARAGEGGRRRGEPLPTRRGVFAAAAAAAEHLDALELVEEQVRPVLGHVQAEEHHQAPQELAVARRRQLLKPEPGARALGRRRE